MLGGNECCQEFFRLNATNVNYPSRQELPKTRENTIEISAVCGC